MYGAEFGCCDNKDIEAILLQYCQNFKDNCSWAIVGCCENDDILSKSCKLLIENNVQLSTFICSINQ